MAKTAITVGVLLILIGIVSYVGSGGASMTALIPAFFGVPIFACGLVAQNELRRKHAMHVAVVFGLLGFLGALRFIPQLGQAFSGQAERPMAVYAGTVMCIICLGFVIACVKSFIAARKAL